MMHCNSIVVSRFDISVLIITLNWPLIFYYFTFLIERAEECSGQCLVFTSLLDSGKVTADLTHPPVRREDSNWSRFRHLHSRIQKTYILE